MIVDDFNNDNRLDVLVTLPNAQQVVLLISTGELDNLFIPHTYDFVELIPDYFTIGDINGDGLKDICVLSQLEETLLVLLNDSDFSFQERLKKEIFYDDDMNNLFGDGFNYPLCCADLDEDMRDELYLIREGSTGFDSIFQYRYEESDNSLVLSEMKELVIEEKSFTDIMAFDFIDIDGNQIPELVIFPKEPLILLYLYNPTSQL